MHFSLGSDLNDLTLYPPRRMIRYGVPRWSTWKCRRLAWFSAARRRPSPVEVVVGEAPTSGIGEVFAQHFAGQVPQDPVGEGGAVGPRSFPHCTAGTLLLWPLVILADRGRTSELYSCGLFVLSRVRFGAGIFSRGFTRLPSSFVCNDSMASSSLMSGKSL